jgi:hypothetical protein
MRASRWTAQAGLLAALVTASATHAQVGSLTVTSFDELILVRADELLSDHSAWNQFDDRDCADDEAEAKRSLFCALVKASIELTGVYDHRSAALQEVRRVVEELTPGRRFKHPLMNFNNRSETGFSDVKNVLSVALGRIRAQLKATN